MTGTNSTELSRRDALAALAATGIAGGGVVALSASDDGEGRDSDGDTTTETGRDRPPGPVAEGDIEILTAAAAVLYPSEVAGVETFVSRFVRGRAAEQPDHAAGIVDAVASLDAPEREDALDQLGVRTAEPDPDGTDVERVRYYVVNELLFALYSSPTGGELVGLENPQGHPGGIDSYRRGPDE
jgi:hypothetical protein